MPKSPVSWNWFTLIKCNGKSGLLWPTLKHIDELWEKINPTFFFSSPDCGHWSCYERAVLQLKKKRKKKKRHLELAKGCPFFIARFPVFHARLIALLKYYVQFHSFLFSQWTTVPLQVLVTFPVIPSVSAEKIIHSIHNPGTLEKKYF